MVLESFLESLTENVLKKKLFEHLLQRPKAIFIHVIHVVVHIVFPYHQHRSVIIN